MNAASMILAIAIFGVACFTLGLFVADSVCDMRPQPKIETQPCDVP